MGTAGIKVLLRSRLPEEIARGNVAAGVAAGAHFAATGFIVAECFYGDDLPALGISIVFFAIGQAALLLFVVLFRTLTLYADDQEIQGENVAAAVSYAGAMLAIALIVGMRPKATSKAGARRSTRTSCPLSVFVLFAGLGIVVFVVAFALVVRLAPLDLWKEIARERNVGVSAVEAVSYLAAAILLTGLE